MQNLLWAHRLWSEGNLTIDEFCFGCRFGKENWSSFPNIKTNRFGDHSAESKSLFLFVADAVFISSKSASPRKTVANWYQSSFHTAPSISTCNLSYGKAQYCENSIHYHVSIATYTCWEDVVLERAEGTSLSSTPYVAIITMSYHVLPHWACIPKKWSHAHKRQLAISFLKSVNLFFLIK